MTRKLFFTQFSAAFLITFFISQCFSQGIAIGQWRDHLPYNRGKTLTIAGSKVYYASESGMFVYNNDSKEINRISKVTGLSDIGFSKLKYDDQTQTLIIAYSNANIDLIKPEGIININDIARKNIPGGKSINNIHIKDGFAYLACGFGIVKLDLKKNEIKDTYIIGADGTTVEINAIISNNDKMFAATGKGLYQANLSSSNLADYNNWSLVNGFPDYISYEGCAWYSNALYASHKNTTSSNCDTIYSLKGNIFKKDTIPGLDFTSMEVYNNKLFIIANSNTFVFDGDNQIENLYAYSDNKYSYPNEIIQTADGTYWIADRDAGLVKSTGNWNSEFINVNSPPSPISAAQDSYNGKVYVAAGTVSSSWGYSFNGNGTYVFEDESWNQKAGGEKYFGADTFKAYDIVDVYADRVNPNKFYAASFFGGLLEYENDELVKVYDSRNSTIQKDGINYADRVAGVTGDADGNIWITNSLCNSPISVKKVDGKWKSMYLGYSLQNTYMGEIVIDDFGNKWLQLVRSGGIAVFTDNGTIDNSTDDKYKRLGTTPGTGALPSQEIYAIVKDKDGNIWVGSDKGIFVFYSPGDIFSSSPSDAAQILVTQDSIAGYLLEAETVSAIAVDGANRKWIGTQKSGLYLMSADGVEQIEHFTTENSPLFSNNIISLSINDKTGEVFIATEKGIISYRGDATEGIEDIDKKQVMAFPNPVRPGYEGKIAIRGLTTNAAVRITDASGELVHSSTAYGGQAIWDGNTIEGQRAKSGIYLVFSADEKGKETVVTKVLLIN